MIFSIRSNWKGHISPRPLIIAVLFVFAIIPQNSFSAEKKLPRDKVKVRIKLSRGPIISGSDSLIADSIGLKRDTDYSIDYLSGAIILSIPDSFLYDTLYVHYSPLPSWLKSRYGNPVGRTVSSNIRANGEEAYSPLYAGRGRGSEVKISGAKSFSFLTQTAGGSQFNQSLELTIKGKLTDDLTVTGAVADRGYDPQYGTINSRINELDKIHLKVSSNSFLAEIGNIELIRPSEYRDPIIKQVSGIQSAYYGRHLSAKAAVANPKGRYETIRFYGSDQVQGPYRVRTGNILLPIVPGSEAVWVDGRQLERGAGKDYIMDYPAATIIFTVQVPIDSRSRIEIDFEPLTSEYQKELYQVGGGAAVADSIFTLSMEYLSEGDNRNRYKGGDLSESEIEILENVGDSIDAAVRDGAVLDSTGAYVERLDSLGNRYFEYVGDGNGDYRVTFSAFEKGNYSFEGGNRYRYVGSGNGGYEPIIRIPVPEGERHYNLKLGFNPADNARLAFQAFGSDYDKNLFSKINDGNNGGGRYLIEGQMGENPGVRSENYGLSFRADFTGADYKAYSRLSVPDYSRKYLIPTGLDTSTARTEIIANAAGITIPQAGLYINVNYLEYRNRFKSTTGEITFYPSDQFKYLPLLTVGAIESDKTSNGIKHSGEARIGKIEWSYNFDNRSGMRITGRFDRRKNDYNSEKRGTTERAIRLSSVYGIFRFNLERYDEDTLIANVWQDRILRNRGSLHMIGKVLGVNTDWSLAAQRLKQGASSENQILARLTWAYSKHRRNLSMSGHYGISAENRYQRGIRYIEVEPGQGQFIFEDGQYIPDPQGDYIEVEEILSQQAKVRSGEKSFNITWRPENIYFRLLTNLNEELLDTEQRNLWWIIPGLSNPDKEYLSRRLYYSGDLKLWRRRDFYFAAFSGSYNYESRRISSSDNERYDWQTKLTFHENYSTWHFLQNGELFKYQRDQYFNSSGNIDGYKLSGESYFETFWGRMSGLLGYRYAEDASGANSKQILVEINPIIRYIRNGETSLKIEGYYQELRAGPFVSYRLTDNRPGKNGLIWTIRSEYIVSKSVRLTLYINGRHADNRTPRYTGKGEMVANF